MSDLCRVLVVGNLHADIERRQRADGVTVGVSTVCASRTALVSGQPLTEVVQIPIEVVGGTRVSAVAQQFGSGSRVLLEGHLALRSRYLGQANHAERPDAIAQFALVLVIETIFNAETPLPSAEAQQQPEQFYWDGVT